MSEAVVGAKSRKHIGELDGVRALSILCVLAAHMLPLGPSWMQLNSMAGVMGMSLFFGLSGFLITYFLWIRPNIYDFLIRRMLRIVPLVYLYAATVALVIYARPDSFAAILTFTLNYRDEQLFFAISHLWSICVEMHFYLAIAIAVGLFGRRGFWVVPLAAIVVMLLRVESGALVSIRTHLRVDEILSGALLGLYWLNREELKWQRLERFIAKSFPLLFLFWLLSCHQISGALMYLRPYSAMLVIGSILLMRDNRIKQILRHKYAAYIAEISYALYIWHRGSVLGWFGAGNTLEKYLFKRPISFLLSFGVSHFSTRVFESKFIAIGKRLTRQN